MSSFRQFFQNTVPTENVSYRLASSSMASDDFAAWQEEKQREQQRIDAIAAHLQQRRRGLTVEDQPLTVQRLERVAAAMQHNIAEVDRWLEPLATARTGNFHRLMSDGAKRSDVGLEQLRYLVRDWSDWGQLETQQMMAALEPALAVVLSSQPRIERLVAPGAGALRLPLEVAQRLAAIELIAIEKDPLLSYGAARLAAGEVLNIFDIPLEPQSHQHCTVEYRLQAEHALLSSVKQIEVCGGDANEALLKTQPDVLFTPFIIDVAGGDILQRCQRWARHLKPGASWVNIGPISVRQPHTPQNVSVEEIRQALTQAGMEILHDQTVAIPHLNAPYNRRKQFYDAWIFAARRR